jgi:hypothetical protein
LTVPELSPSDPTSNASSPSSSVPVTPLDPPTFATTQADPLAHGKHQPDPHPFRPVSKSASRLGTVWRARQVLFSLGKRKRRASAETSISTGVDRDSELLTDYYDVPELPDSNSAPEITEPRQSLFSLPNGPIDSMPSVRPAYKQYHPIMVSMVLTTHIPHFGKYAHCRLYASLPGAAARIHSHQSHRAQ